MKTGLVLLPPLPYPRVEVFHKFFYKLVKYNLSFESKVYCKLIMKVNKYIHTYIQERIL